MSAERIIAIHMHPNADAIELADVLGWRVVVKKDEFKVGELVLYYRIDAILPQENPDYAFLGGKALKTKKIRGELSQGLCGPLAWASWHGVDPATLSAGAEGRDLTAEFSRDGKLGKREDDEGGNEGGASSILPFGVPKTREARVQDCPRIIREMVGKPVVMTRKEDGTSFTVIHCQGETALCSRTQHLEAVRGGLQDASDLSSHDKNVAHYLAIEHELGLRAKLAATGLDLALQGEVCGPKINGNRMKLDKLIFRAYKVWDIKQRAYWSRKRTELFLAPMGIEMVPIVWRGIFTAERASVAALLAEAEQVHYDGQEDILGEGFVCMTDSDDGVLHHSFKVISNEYLLAHDAPHAKKKKQQPSSTK